MLRAKPADTRASRSNLLPNRPRTTASEDLLVQIAGAGKAERPDPAAVEHDFIAALKVVASAVREVQVENLDPVGAHRAH